MMIRISKGTEIYQKRGRFTVLDEKLPDGYMVLGMVGNEANNVQARSLVARNEENMSKAASSTKGKTKVGYRKTEARQCKNVGRYLLH